MGGENNKIEKKENYKFDIDYDMEFLGPGSVSPDKFPIITKQTENSIC